MQNPRYYSSPATVKHVLNILERFGFGRPTVIATDDTVLPEDQPHIDIDHEPADAMRQYCLMVHGEPKNVALSYAALSSHGSPETRLLELFALLGQEGGAVSLRLPAEIRRAWDAYQSAIAEVIRKAQPEGR